MFETPYYTWIIRIIKNSKRTNLENEHYFRAKNAFFSEIFKFHDIYWIDIEKLWWLIKNLFFKDSKDLFWSGTLR